MNEPALETLLARIYTDAEARTRFLADPARVAREHGLDARTAAQLCAIDRAGLVLTADSLASKREKRRVEPPLWQLVRAWLGVRVRAQKPRVMGP